MTRVGLAFSAWKADTLPLSYIRMSAVNEDRTRSLIVGNDVLCRIELPLHLSRERESDPRKQFCRLSPNHSDIPA